MKHNAKKSQKHLKLLNEHLDFIASLFTSDNDDEMIVIIENNVDSKNVFISQSAMALNYQYEAYPEEFSLQIIASLLSSYIRATEELVFQFEDLSKIDPKDFKEFYNKLQKNGQSTPVKKEPRFDKSSTIDALKKELDGSGINVLEVKSVDDLVSLIQDLSEKSDTEHINENKVGIDDFYKQVKQMVDTRMLLVPNKKDYSFSISYIKGDFYSLVVKETNGNVIFKATGRTLDSLSKSVDETMSASMNKSFDKKAAN